MTLVCNRGTRQPLGSAFQESAPRMARRMSWGEYFIIFDIIHGFILFFFEIHCTFFYSERLADFIPEVSMNSEIGSRSMIILWMQVLFFDISALDYVQYFWFFKFCPSRCSISTNLATCGTTLLRQRKSRFRLLQLAAQFPVRANVSSRIFPFSWRKNQ